MEQNPEIPPPLANVHVYPDTGREHETPDYGTACWCFPRVEDYTSQGGSKLVVHNQES